MNKVSFEEIGQVAATFYAAAGVSTGDVAKLSADSTVSACAAGDAGLHWRRRNRRGRLPRPAGTGRDDRRRHL